MKFDSYFKNPSKYWSANFLAMIGFANIAFFLYLYFPKSLEHLAEYNNISDIFVYLLIASGVSTYFFGTAAVYEFCTISIPLFFLLNAKNKHSTILSLSALILILSSVIVLSNKWVVQHVYSLLFIFFEFIEIYSKYLALLFCAFLSIPFLCWLDRKKELPIPNTGLIENKYYKIFVNIFFYLFWITYILFGFVLLFIILINISTFISK